MVLILQVERMKKEGYYSSGQLAKIAGITKKTIRYYDEHGILRPSLVTESGARFYTDLDLAKLQQILMLKSLGFSLEDISEITISWDDRDSVKSSLDIQLRMVEDRIDQLNQAADTIREITQDIDKDKGIDWQKMMQLSHISGMERSLKKQYMNTANISSRISLHDRFSDNKTGWFEWIFSELNIRSGMRVLELGCGDGSLWARNLAKVPTDIEILLTDISEGTLRDARRNIGKEDTRFRYRVCDCQDLLVESESFDLVIANHVLFYCEDIRMALQEIRRVLKPSGAFACATYGSRHMKEISKLVSDFDSRILLSSNNLYNVFGKENGEEILRPFFKNIVWKQYEDHLMVTDAKPLILYILSCHGNQIQYIADRYGKFREYVERRTAKGFRITKDAGIFLSQK